MKKLIISGLLLIGVGFLLGNIIFYQRDFFEKKIKSQETYYFLQEGVYSNRDILENNLTNISKAIIDYQNNQYYVYVGITKNEMIAKKIQEIYQKKGYQIVQKIKRFSSEEFYNNVTQFDLLIQSVSSDDEILTIEEVVLANYEEILKKQ